MIRYRNKLENIYFFVDNIFANISAKTLSTVQQENISQGEHKDWLKSFIIFLP